MGIKVPKVVVFWTISTIKDEKSVAKIHYIKTILFTYTFYYFTQVV